MFALIAFHLINYLLIKKETTKKRVATKSTIQRTLDVASVRVCVWCMKLWNQQNSGGFPKTTISGTLNPHMWTYFPLLCFFSPLQTTTISNFVLASTAKMYANNKQYQWNGNSSDQSSFLIYLWTSERKPCAATNTQISYCVGCVAKE